MRSFLQRKGFPGFTLIELLVVIAIIGVLASIVLASLNNARRKSRDARRISDLKQIQLALELYFDGQIAPQYIVSTTACSPTEAGGLEALTLNGYIPQVPRDPNRTTPNNCYNYATVATSPTTYHLGAVLEEATNPALNSDKDCDSSLLVGVAGNCGFTAAAGAFNGRGAGANGDDPTAPVYDLIP